MKIENAIALVMGANRGIGLTFTRELLARGFSDATAPRVFHEQLGFQPGPDPLQP
jgi:NAD(P)-dependent dehydrogenase (short-subunit alcohol dehydrogenase family)